MLFIATGLLIYSNTFASPFHFDDLVSIVQNQSLRDFPDNSAWFFFNPRRFIGYLTFALNYQVHQLDVWGYHLVNLTIHILNALLVWWLVSLLFNTPVLRDKPIAQYRRSIALFTSWLFMAHPLMTESVTYIVQRLVSLSSLFYLFSLILYLKARLSSNTMSRILFFSGTLVTALLAFFTKEVTYTLPVILLLFEFFFFDRQKNMLKKRYLLVIGILVVVVITGSLILLFSGKYMKDILPREGHPYTITIGAYYLTQLRVLVSYFRLILYPANQRVDYEFPLSHSLIETDVIISAFFLSCLLLLAILTYKRHRLISFGIFWFFITIAPQSLVPRPNVIFEHRAYLSSIGVILVLVVLFYQNLGRFRIRKRHPVTIAGLLLFVAVFALSVKTYQRNDVWKSELSLWSDCVEKDPGNARGWMNLGAAKQKEHDLPGARLAYDQALLIWPDYIQALNNRGVTRATQGEYVKAIEDFSKAIRLQPSFQEARINRALTYYQQQRFKETVEDIDIILKADPANEPLRKLRSLLLDNQ